LQSATAFEDVDETHRVETVLRRVEVVEGHADEFALVVAAQMTEARVGAEDAACDRIDLHQTDATGRRRRRQGLCRAAGVPRHRAARARQRPVGQRVTWPLRPGGLARARCCSHACASLTMTAVRTAVARVNPRGAAGVSSVVKSVSKHKTLQGRSSSAGETVP
jgi:hypothetical protein